MVAMLGMATSSTWAQGVGALSFMTHAWDDTQKKVTTTFEDLYEGTYSELSGNHSDDWVGLGKDSKFAVTGNATYQVLNITGQNAHLYICDGVTLNVNHIKLEKGASLHIHAQSRGNSNFGKLVVKNDEYSSAAGIGGGDEKDAGDLYIHGGDITVTGNDFAAGIGGGDGGSGGNVYIYDGKVTVDGGTKAAGIGGGQNRGIANDCSVNIYGGTVSAYGHGNNNQIVGEKSGAGIGGGDDADQGGTVNIYGGTVTAEAKYKYAAGIGGGNKRSGGVVNIYGGTVTARGNYDGAGIGGGNKGDGGTVTIYGGTVYAYGGSYGAGIGRGAECESNNTRITISGGTVVSGSENGSAGHAMTGTLTLTDGLRVLMGSKSTNIESTPVAYADRVGTCVDNLVYYENRCVKVEPCENHHYVDYVCTYCSKEYYETATGTWSDDGIRASEFSNETNTTVTITNEAELGLLEYNISNRHFTYDGWTFLLAKDLDMSAHKWAAKTGTFLGTFDGQGHTISGLNYSKDNQGNAGLIAHNSGTIKNVKLANSIIVGKKYVGAIAGQNTGTVENCHVGADVSVTNSDNSDDSKGCGGIVGFQTQGQLATEGFTPVTRGCYSEASVNGYGNVGGIVGQIDKDTKLTDCVSKATVNCKSSDGKKGILAGLIVEGATLENNGYFSETVQDNAHGARLISVTLADDLEAGGHKIYYGGPVKNNYNVSGIKCYWVPQLTFDGKWYVEEGEYFTFSLRATKDSEPGFSYCYVTVNGTGQEPAGREYTFNATDHAARYVVDAIAFQGEGTAASPYLIQTAADWNTLCRAANVVPANDLFAGKHFKQTADIEVTQGFGVTGEPSSKAFCGTYDGGGHTLAPTVVMYNVTEAVATFYKLKNATVKNLTVGGYLLGGIHTAGLAAFTEGDILIYNARVQAHVDCGGNDYNDAHGGGFIGHAGNSKIEMWYSFFDGDLRARTNGKGDVRLGAFVGWSATNVKQFYCVERGNYTGISDDYTKVAFNWVDNNGSGDQSTSYNLCLSDLVNNSQVEKARRTFSDSWGLDVNIQDKPQDTWGNGGFQTDKNNNFFVGDEIYSTKTVHFTVSVAEGKELRQVRCNDKDITPVGDLYTVDMPADNDAVITAVFKYWSDDEFSAVEFSCKDGDVILITTPQELALLAKRTNEGNISNETTYRLANDINLSEHEWKPIGTEFHIFVSTFEGKGHTISGMRILGDDVNVGLFGYSYGRVNNIKLSNSKIQGSQNVGGIAGTTTLRLENCYVDNTVTVKAIKTADDESGKNAGGIAGQQIRAPWSGAAYPFLGHSYSAATVEGNTNVGGICGAHSGYAYWSVSEAVVKGISNVGGISGETYTYRGYVFQDISAAKVRGYLFTGALVGRPYNGDVDPYRVQESYYISPAKKLNDKDIPAIPVVLSEELSKAGATMSYEPCFEEEFPYIPYSGLAFYNEEHSVFSIGDKWYAAEQSDVNFFLDKPEGYTWTKVMLNGEELKPADDGHYTFKASENISEFIVTADLTTGISPVTTQPTLLDDTYYDLNGRKLSGKPALKGIYIFNGKKVVIK